MAPTKAAATSGVKVTAKAWAALELVVTATDEMRTAEVARSRARRQRAKAIGTARAGGLTLDIIGQRLGVSRERVRQMSIIETSTTTRAKGIK